MQFMNLESQKGRILKKRWREPSIVTCIILCMFLLCPKNAYAIQEISYNNDLGFSVHYDIDTFLMSEFNTDISSYDVASVDLNQDGLNEYILKKKICAPDNGHCLHLILAEKNGALFTLSKIRAKVLMLGGTLTNGINDLLAFNEGVNDYDFDIYMWSPKEKTYMLKKNDIEE